MRRPRPFLVARPHWRGTLLATTRTLSGVYTPTPRKAMGIALTLHCAFDIAMLDVMYTVD
jgi:hypothetical protein